MGSAAEESTWREGVLSSFALPWEDLYAKPYASEWMNSLSGLSIDIGASYPLQKTMPATGKGKPTNNTTLQFSAQYNPLSYWFINATVPYYLDPSQKQPDDPAYSYIVGYDDWHPFTLGLTYSNSANIPLNQGVVTLAWKPLLPESWTRPFVVGYGDSLGCGTAFTWTPSYTNANTHQQARNKTVWTLGCKYTIIGNWYVNFTLYGYPHALQQQPWNPDYTYGFGYFDWHPGTFSIQYNNYSGNRFSSSERAANTGTFQNGIISLDWSTSW